VYINTSISTGPALFRTHFRAFIQKAL